MSQDLLLNSVKQKYRMVDTHLELVGPTIEIVDFNHRCIHFLQIC